MVHSLITLYPQNETEFTTNGLGSLGEAASCVVTQEANGSYELEMEYPVSGRRFRDISNRSIIYTQPNPYSSPQAFRVYNITRPMNGLVTYYAAHISYDLAGIPVEPFEAKSCQQAMNGLKEHSIVPHNFTFYTNIVKDADFWPFEPKPARTLLGSDEGCILDLYGGDYEFDNFNVRLLTKRGTDRGFTIRYGKNLTEFSHEEDGTSTYSAVYPYWVDNQTEELITLPEKTIPTKGTHNYTNILTLDLSSALEDGPTDEELRAAAQQYIDDNELGVPTASLEVSFVQLSQTEEYKDYAILERVELFDTVTVEYPELGVSAKMTVSATSYDVLARRYSSVTLGKIKGTITTTIADERDVITEEIASTSDDLQASIDRATKWITNGKGYMVAVQDEAGNWKEICSLNTPDINTATKVWRWNNGGFGFSANGYNGEYRLAITQDGHIVADFIDTGTLTANIIRAGTLKGKTGDNMWNLDTGEFTLTSAQTKVGGSNLDSYVDGRSKTQADKAVDEQTQQEIFDKLTNKGVNQGIYLSGGNLYLNATMMQTGILNADLIKAGIIKGKNGVNSWNMDTGEFTLSTATKLDSGSQTLSGYVDSTSKTNANSAAKSAVDAQTQQDIFDKLTNKGVNQGIYLSNGQLYLNATMLQSGIINADLIQAGTLKDKAGNVTFNLTDGILNMKNGRIEATTINGGDDIPFSANRRVVRVGDFEVNDDYGRHIFQSTDEVTGMSTGDVSGGRLYFWAGYGKSDRGNGVFMVNAEKQVHINGGLYVNGNLYINGVDIVSLIKDQIPDACYGYSCNDCDDCSDIPCLDCDEDGCGSDACEDCPRNQCPDCPSNTCDSEVCKDAPGCSSYTAPCSGDACGITLYSGGTSGGYGCADCSDSSSCTVVGGAILRQASR